jgi:hypothetical protein
VVSDGSQQLLKIPIRGIDGIKGDLWYVYVVQLERICGYGLPTSRWWTMNFAPWHFAGGGVTIALDFQRLHRYSHTPVPTRVRLDSF